MGSIKKSMQKISHLKFGVWCWSGFVIRISKNSVYINTLLLMVLAGFVSLRELGGVIK